MAYRLARYRTTAPVTAISIARRSVPNSRHPEMPGSSIGSSSVTAAPFVGPLPGSQDTTNYLSIGGNGTETITFASEKNTFGLYWGSLDSYNTIKFYDGTTLVASYTGEDISRCSRPATRVHSLRTGMWNSPACIPLTRSCSAAARTHSRSTTFPPDTFRSRYQTSGPIKGTLSVHDSDIGDTLTAFVIGNATIDYNGLTSVPGGIDISALVDAGDVTFDSAPSNGGTVVLNWTYHPTNANLDFLHAGDILKINFVAEVSDGHGPAGSQPLTITLVGAGNTANASLSLATGPVIDTDCGQPHREWRRNDHGVGLACLRRRRHRAERHVHGRRGGSSAGGSVIPPAAGGSLAAVNATLSSGIGYDPGNDPPQTDMVTLTVSDGLGHSDTVHFVFNEAGQGPVTLTGTSGKDVIFATGSDDTLTGGGSADQFVFAPGQNPSADTITDFTPGQDRIDLRLFSEVVGADNINGWLSADAVQSSTNPADVLITLGNDSDYAEERRCGQPACQRLHRVAASEDRRSLTLSPSVTACEFTLGPRFRCYLLTCPAPRRGGYSEVMKRLRALPKMVRAAHRLCPAAVPCAADRVRRASRRRPGSRRRNPRQDL